MKVVVAFLGLLACAVALFAFSDPHYGFVFLIGQSLAVGQAPALSTEAAGFGNINQQGTWPTALVETDRETPASGAVNQISSLGHINTIYAIGKFGNAGAAYSLLRKGNAGCTSGMVGCYASNMVYANLASTRAGANTYSFPWLLLEHGQSDFQCERLGNCGAGYEDYLANLVQWQSDYETDLKAISGQAGTIPFFLTQMSTWTYYNSATPTATGLSCAAPICQWWAVRDHYGTFYAAAPEYPYFANTKDGLHVDATNSRVLGQLYGKAVDRAYRGLVPGMLPRRITAATATTITVRMWVPEGVLAIDTTTVTDKGNGKGFELVDSGGNPVSVTSAVTVSGDTATIPVADSSAVARVRYAYTGTSGQGGGTAGGAHGNIRDTGSTGYYGDALHDWLWTFDEPVGFSWEPIGASATHGTRMAGTWK